jgi:hypothetical protein
MDVSSEAPARIAHAEAPEPRCRAIMLVCDAGLERYDETARRMKA